MQKWDPAAHLLRVPPHRVPHFGHSRFLKRQKRILIRSFNQPLGTFLVPPISGFLIAQRDLPSVRNIHDAYSHGCDGSALFDRIGCRGSVVPSPSCRWWSSLCGSAGRLVRMVYAWPGRQRSRPLVQSRPVLGPLWIKCRWPNGRRYRRLASPRRQDCRPGKRAVDRAERQRRPCRSDASAIGGWRYRVPVELTGWTECWCVRQSENEPHPALCRPILKSARATSAGRFRSSGC